MKQLTFGEDFSPEKPLTMREIPTSDRPRERLELLGAGALSDSELLSILLITGTKGTNVLDLARALLTHFESHITLARANLHELMSLDGIGKSKALRILAALELGKRLARPRNSEDPPRVTSPADAANYVMADMQLLEKEHLRVINLTTRNHIISCPTIYIGSVNSTSVHVGELFREAIRINAAAIIVVHNHPSGDPSPSPEDINVTRQIVKVGKLVDIDVLDHLIIGRGIFVSLKERRLGFD